MEKKFFRYNYRTYVAQFSENGNGNLWCYVEEKFQINLRDTSLIYLGRFENGIVIPSEKIRNCDDYSVDVGSRRLSMCLYNYFKLIDKRSSIMQAICMAGHVKTEENKIIYELRQKGIPFIEIAKKFKKAKSTIIKRYYRHVERLSTGDISKPLAEGRLSGIIKIKKVGTTKRTPKF